jgi:hypothetical protein
MRRFDAAETVVFGSVYGTETININNGGWFTCCSHLFVIFLVYCE